MESVCSASLKRAADNLADDREPPPFDERMHGHLSAAPPKGILPQGFRFDAVREHGDSGKDGFRNEHGPLRLPAQAFQSGGRVHDVAEVGDLVPVDAYLGRDDTAAMQSRAKFRDKSEPSCPSGTVIAERSSDREDAVDAPRPLDALHQWP